MNVGDVISHYILEEKVGDGGFGDVYRARDINTGMQIAIKCSRPDACESKLIDREQRFMREVSCISKLRHQNIVQLFDYGATPDGTLFLVMEYIFGLNLEILIKRDAPFSFVYASEIILQVLDALDEAHRQGIVHRDLKPANIMLVRQGLRSDFVKLLDFGIAKAFDGTEPDLTRQNFQKGAGFGTPQYMPPEQFYGKKIGPHTDLYAVGLVLYELLVGKPAFDGKTLSELINQQLNKFPDIPAPFNQGPLYDVFRRALAKQIGMRYSSAQEMYHDIDAIIRLQSPFLEIYSGASGMMRPSGGERYVPAAATVDYSDDGFEQNDEPSTVDTQLFDERADISGYNTLVFDGIAQPRLKPPVPPVGFWEDPADPENMIPTDDMSRVDPALALQAAEAAATNRQMPMNRASLPSTQVSPIYHQPPAPLPPIVDHSDMPTHMLPEMNSTEMGIDTQSLQQRPELANVGRATPRAIQNASNLSSLNTLMVTPDVMPPPAYDPPSEDLPPVFHQQRTNFIRQNNLLPRQRPTYIDSSNVFKSLLFRIMMSRPMTAFMNSGFYRSCRHLHHRISMFIDDLYADHFPELVAVVCITIIILTLIIAMLVM